MNVTCPNCATIYRVDPAKVPEAGVRARCAVCNAVFAVRREVEQGMPAPAAPPAAPPRPQPAPPRPEPPRAEPSRPVPPPAPPRSEPPAPAKTEPGRPAAPAGMPPRGPASPAPPSPAAPAPRPAAPAAPGVPPRPAAPARPAAGTPAAAAAAPAPAARPAAPAPESPKTGAAAPAQSKPAVPAGSRPTNPFLSQDPTLKAKRLARALISDMVVYHPGKRQEGLRDGNLKELFEEEIKKSFDEYADQVGREVAESTSYFREALNEILAGGRQIF